MPETPVTREQLLASVHELHDGDLLVFRLPADTTMEGFKLFTDQLAEMQLPDGVRPLVLTNNVAMEVVRPGNKASDLTEAVARAKANPGQVVEVRH